MNTPIHNSRPGFKSLISSLPRLDIPILITKEEGTFPLFQKLPIELRRYIWTYVSCEQRTIYFHFDDKPSLVPSYGFGEKTTITRQTRYPAILATCQEARFEGLRHYTPILEHPHDSGRHNVAYFNSKADTFRSRLDGELDTLMNHDFHRVNLTVDGKIFPLERMSILSLEVEMQVFGLWFGHNAVMFGKMIALSGVKRMLVVLLWPDEEFRDDFESRIDAGMCNQLDIEIKYWEAFQKQIVKWGSGIGTEITFRWGTGINHGLDPSEVPVIKSSSGTRASSI